MRASIDLNCDMGESFGTYRLGNDEELLRWVSSANIACGFHAGDASVMRRTVRLCLEQGVHIGAHPGLPDLQGFGRRPMAIKPEQIYEIALYQIGALQSIARAEGGQVEHIKPHGALYHMAESDPEIAASIARAAADAGGELALFGLSGGRLIAAGRAHGLRVRQEAFADRAYRIDGSLLPRGEPGAVATDPAVAARQALRLAREGEAATTDGKLVSVAVDTICIHGDSPHALDHVRSIHEALTKHGIRVERAAHNTK